MFDLGVSTEKSSSSKLSVDKYLSEQQIGIGRGGRLVTSPLSSVTSAGSNLTPYYPIHNQLQQSTVLVEDLFQERQGNLSMNLQSTDKRKKNNASNSTNSKGRKPGRPPSLFVNVSDSELTEEERKLKAKILKRRQRQNRSYQKKKLEKNRHRVNAVEPAIANNQVGSSVAPNYFMFANSSSSMDSGHALYDSEVKFSNCYLDEMEDYPSNSFSCTSSFEETSLDDPLHQLLRQDSSCESVCATQDHDSNTNNNSNNNSICQDILWPPYRLSLDSCVTDPFSSTTTCIRWKRFQSIFDNLSTSAQEAWKAFSIFSDSFDLNAAIHILGYSESERSLLLNTIDVLEQANILEVDDTQNRMQLFPLAKYFMMEHYFVETNTSNRSCSMGYDQQKWEILKYRYLSYYSQRIQQHVNDAMFLQLGSCRKQALCLYNLERANIEQAFQFSKELGWRTLRWFLVTTRCLWRYVWDVSTRTEQYRNLLERDDIQSKSEILSESPVGIEQLYLDNMEKNRNMSFLEYCYPCFDEENDILRMLGEVYFERKDWSNAHAYLSRCLYQTSQRETSSQLQQPQKCTNNEIFCLYLLACIEKENGKWNIALSLAEKARDECIRMHLESSAFWIQLHLLMTNIYIKLSRFDEAYSSLMNVAECIESSNVGYDLSLIIELDALLGTIMQWRGKETLAQQCLDSIRRKDSLPCFHESESQKNICSCDYLLDYSMWSCLESFVGKQRSSSDNKEDVSPVTWIAKEDTSECCRYLLETGLTAIQEELEWEKSIP